MLGLRVLDLGFRVGPRKHDDCLQARFALEVLFEGVEGSAGMGGVAGSGSQVNPKP